MSKAKFVNTITVKDPDSNNNVEISIFKHENGGMFAIDSSYLDQCFQDENNIPTIPDPFVEKEYFDVKLLGL